MKKLDLSNISIEGYKVGLSVTNTDKLKIIVDLEGEWIELFVGPFHDKTLQVVEEKGE